MHLLLVLLFLHWNIFSNPVPDCTTTPLEIQHRYSGSTDPAKHWERVIMLPVTGRFVQEGHYVTTHDSFPGGRLFADATNENMDAHLQRAWEIYQGFDSTMTFPALYTNGYEKRWTPAEKGEIGQGSVGDVQATELTPEMELWMMNMMWAPGTRPARGTKFLLSANGKKVVVVAGYETGPAGQQFLGGVTTEVHRWLGTDEDSEITVGYLADQSVGVGPLVCEE